jgi:hypothetical protein
VRLAKHYGAGEMEQAAGQANSFKITTYQFIERLLKNSKLKTKKQKAPNRDETNPLLRRETLFH